MNEKIETKIASTKKFVQKNKTLIAYGAGVAVGITGMAVANRYRPALAMSRDNVKHLRDGGVLAYESPWGTLLAWINPESVDIN